MGEQLGANQCEQILEYEVAQIFQQDAQKVAYLCSLY